MGKLKYSFDYEVANKFCYDMDKNKIYFGGYYDVLCGQYIEINDTILELTVNTADNRYVDLMFDNPQLNLKYKRSPWTDPKKLDEFTQCF